MTVMSNVWSLEKTHTRCIDEPLGKYYRHFADRVYGDASGKIRGLFGATSSNS